MSTLAADASDWFIDDDDFLEDEEPVTRLHHHVHHGHLLEFAPGTYDTSWHQLHNYALDLVTFGGRWGTEGRRTFERSDLDVEVRFANLRDQWTRETATVSSARKIVMHAAYQQIIGLGPQAVPLIIDELRREPGHWFWALTCIVGEDHGAGATDLATAAGLWIDWYENRV